LLPSEVVRTTTIPCTMGFFVLRPALHVSRLFTSMKMSTSAAPLLLTPKQVNDLQTRSNLSVSILDSTWFMPNSPRKAKDEFLAKRIPGAQYLDLDEVASPNQLGLKHMMPSPQTFANACGMSVKFDCPSDFDSNNRESWYYPFKPRYHVNLATACTGLS